MSIPPEIQSTMKKLNTELNYIQQQTQHGLAILRPLLDRFPSNNLLVQFYGSLNNSLFLVDVYQRRIKILAEMLQQETLPTERNRTDKIYRRRIKRFTWQDFRIKNKFRKYNP